MTYLDVAMLIYNVKHHNKLSTHKHTNINFLGSYQEIKEATDCSIVSQNHLNKYEGVHIITYFKNQIGRAHV